MHADSVVFRLHKGQATIEAYKDGRNTADGFEARHNIYARATLRDYSADHYYVEPADLPRFNGFVIKHSGVRFNDDLRTLIGRLGIGDTVTLAWTRGNNNENNRGIGWSRDELRLIIAKPKGKTESYLVDVNVGPDNSARMITLAR
jgi:hypothetical protein